MDVIEVKSNMSTTVNENSFFNTDISLASLMNYDFELTATMTAQLILNSPVI